jgi:hypothetical protein
MATSPDWYGCGEVKISAHVPRMTERSRSPYVGEKSSPLKSSRIRIAVGRKPLL